SVTWLFAPLIVTSGCTRDVSASGAGAAASKASTSTPTTARVRESIGRPPSQTRGVYRHIRTSGCVAAPEVVALVDRVAARMQLEEVEVAAVVRHVARQHRARALQAEAVVHRAERGVAGHLPALTREHEAVVARAADLVAAEAQAAADDQHARDHRE